MLLICPKGFLIFLLIKRLTNILPPALIEDVHQYTPMAGYSITLKNLASKKKSNNRTINPETEILLITAGATQGILLLYKPY
jgi:methionine aminotransferase